MYTINGVSEFRRKPSGLVKKLLWGLFSIDLQRKEVEGYTYEYNKVHMKRNYRDRKIIPC